MTEKELQSLTDDAVLDFTLGDVLSAQEKINECLEHSADFFPALLAAAEIYFSQKDFSQALQFGQRALVVKEEDLHLHVTLSRIYAELENKEDAEKHNARARVLGWKVQLNEEK